MNVLITRTYLLQILSEFQEAYNLEELLQVQNPRSDKKRLYRFKVIKNIWLKHVK